jgi:murein DD-endopeptidase MepM/ murein hydrolase activator NlpD
MLGLRLPSGLLLLAISAGGCENEPANVGSPAGTNISVTPVTLLLSVGASAQLAATVRGLDGTLLTGREVEWSSSAPAIAAVSESGIVTAIAPGTATVGAYSDQSVGFARVVVQLEFRLPVPSTRSLLTTEIGTASAGCPAGEGGLRADGGRDCRHAGISRYSLDFRPMPEHPAFTAVGAAADGRVDDVCVRPPTEVTCGPNGPFVYIVHGAGFATFYSHLDPASITVRRKMTVQQGDVLGHMGSWGDEGYPWMHFELRLNKQDPGDNRVLDNLLVDGRRFADYRVSE